MKRLLIAVLLWCASGPLADAACTLTINPITGKFDCISPPPAGGGAPVGGSGTIDTIPRFSAASTLADSQILQGASLITFDERGLRLNDDPSADVDVTNSGGAFRVQTGGGAGDLQWSATGLSLTGTSTTRFTMNGSTSGAGALGVAAVAGTPNTILLPTATATAGYFFVSNGASPQVTSWSNTLPAGTLLSGFTEGSVLFAGASGAITQDNPNLFYDSTNKRALIGPQTGFSADNIQYYLDVASTSATSLNTSTAAQTSAAQGAGLVGVYQSNDTDLGLIQGVLGLAMSTTEIQNVSGVEGFAEASGDAGGVVAGLRSSASVSGGTTTGLAGLYITGNFKAGAGVATNNYGVLVDDQNVAGATNYAIKTGTGDLSFGGKITTYDAIPTAGLGLPVQVGVVRAVAQVAAIGTTTAFTVGAADSMYDVNFALNCTTTSAAATVNITIGWTDTGNQAQTATLGSAVACTALGAASVGNLRLSFNAKAATTITYATAIVNTPTYDIRGAVYQVTVN